MNKVDFNKISQNKYHKILFTQLNYKTLLKLRKLNKKFKILIDLYTGLNTEDK